MNSWARLKRYEQLGNAVYWLCLIAAAVLVIFCSMTFAGLGGQTTLTWAVFAKWSLLAATIYGFGRLVRKFTSLD
jgi:hypothetical protein